MNLKQYNALEDNIYKVLDDNDEYIKEDTENLLDAIYMHCSLRLSDVLKFAEEYNVSIDWLLGRSDKEWL